jgi:hypothetical protein
LRRNQRDIATCEEHASPVDTRRDDGRDGCEHDAAPTALTSNQRVTAGEPDCQHERLEVGHPTIEE